MHKMPVLITFFNRPEILEQLFKSISNRTDLELFFACDGPRNNTDYSNIQNNWNLVEKYFGHIPENRKIERQLNLGCKLAMKENIDWFFDLNKYGLILEDDCIPNSDFFKYIGNSLIDYESAKNIASVSGTNCALSSFNEPSSLFRESMFPMVWGWGTWAKKWKLYQLEIYDRSQIVSGAANVIFGRENSLKKICFENVFNKRFAEVNSGKIDTWDYSLIASIWRNNLRVLQINANLIVNLGFNAQATHTKIKAPDWVPLAYTIPHDLNFTYHEYESDFDMWLAETVYNCTLSEFLKNNVKKVLFK